MSKKLLTNIYSTAINKRDNYLLNKIAEKLKEKKLPYSNEIYKSIIGVLKKNNTKAYNEFKKIEKERLLLNKNSNTLDDGSLGASGLYDMGLTISMANKASKPKTAAEFLGLLALHTAPKTILELGTNTGISSSYLSILLSNKNSDFKITTLDASVYRQRVAKTIHKNLKIKNIEYISGLFSQTLKKVLNMQSNWDMVFIDGHHQYQPTLDYFNSIYPKCNKNAIIIFDDIRWSIGMRRAWEELKLDTRFLYCVDLYTIGIAIVANSENDSPETFNLYQEETIKLF